jgi:hypothetical protein
LPRRSSAAISALIASTSMLKRRARRAHHTREHNGVCFVQLLRKHASLRRLRQWSASGMAAARHVLRQQLTTGRFP